MRLNLKRVLASVAGLAAAASLVPLMASPAAASPPVGASDQGVALIRTAGGGAAFTSGDSATAFTIRLPVGAACNGDSNEGFRVAGFMVSQAVTLGTLTWNSFGPTPFTTGSATNTRVPLFDVGGTPYNAFPANAATVGGPGEIINIPDFDFDQFTPGQIPAGVYKIGVACINSNAMQEYWDTLITVTTPGGGPAQFNWGIPAAALAPGLNTVTPGNGTLTANFTPGNSFPSATSFTATANPGGFTATGGASPLTIPGLTNGTSYSVTVTATNSEGTSGPSNAISETPVEGARNNVTGVSVTPGAPGSGNATVNWTAPAPNGSGAIPTGYSVVVAGPTASTTTVPFGTNTLALTGLAPGNYTVTVTAQYAGTPPTGTIPASAPVPFSAVGSGLPGIIYQDIDVNRPVGALVLTQVCNSNGAIAADPASPGFPGGLPAVPPANSSTVNTPAANIPGSTPTLTEDGARPADEDPNRPEYPYPTDANGEPNPTYPTHCGLDLGNAQFVTRGPGAGQFFAASGVLNQVTVVDTRDDDSGWTVTGSMSAFTANGGTDSFSGSQLGWNPVMTEDTSAFTDSNGLTYNQTVTPGAAVAPNSANAAGLSTGRTLASAAANNGLGTAILDARLKLLIPVTADSGDYEGTLSITAV